MKEMTFRSTHQVDSNRVLYTPSPFARSCLLHLQEVGTLKALEPHKSARSNLSSYLFFVVLSGEGTLHYEGDDHSLKAGDCVFIDCTKPYSHSTADDLWSLIWVHFDGAQMEGIYQKYLQRGGLPVFAPQNAEAYTTLLLQLQRTASSEDYIRDMRINETLSSLLTMLMEDSWGASLTGKGASMRSLLEKVKRHLDNHYQEKIALDDLADLFYINKYHLMRSFKERYGNTVINYLLYLRISRAKELLRFSSLSVEEISRRCGMEDANYFSRAFRKIEGVSPSQYRKLW